MYILRNYNKFLTGTTQLFRWEDFYIHRHPRDFDKLVKFDSVEDAQTFLDQHLEVEEDFDAWIENHERTEWDGTDPYTERAAHRWPVNHQHYRPKA